MNDANRPPGNDSTQADAAVARVAVYTSGHEPSTLDRQEAALRAFLTTHHPRWQVVAVYRDVAPTGGWRAIRPGLQHLLAAADRGAFDRLLVHRLDRLSRRMQHLTQILDALDAASVTVQTVQEPFDSSTPNGRRILSRWAAFACEHEAARQGRREQRLAARHRRASTATPQPPAPPSPRHGSDAERPHPSRTIRPPRHGGL